MYTQSHKGTDGQKKEMFSAMESCIENCLDCYKVCSNLVDHCLEKGGKHAEAKHIRLLNDCARICNLSADFMMRNSELHLLICDPCAEICRLCAESCEAIADDEVMKRCATACRKCAESCEQMTQEKH